MTGLSVRNKRSRQPASLQPWTLNTEDTSSGLIFCPRVPPASTAVASPGKGQLGWMSVGILGDRALGNMPGRLGEHWVLSEQEPVPGKGSGSSQ